MAERAWTKDDHAAVLKGATKRALTAVGLKMEGAAARLAPVDSGRLRGSITHATYDHVSGTRSASNRSGDAVSRPDDDLTVHVGTNVEYAAYVEYGTYRKPAEGAMTLSFRTGPQSYMRRAFDENRQAAVRLYARELAEALKNGK